MFPCVVKGNDLNENCNVLFTLQTYSAMSGRIAPTPTLGLPSRDTHALRDDSASTDRPLSTQYVENLAKPRLTPGEIPQLDSSSKWSILPILL